MKKIFLCACILGIMLLALRAGAQSSATLVTNAPSTGTFFLLSGNPPFPYPFDPYHGTMPVYSYDGVFYVDDSQVGLMADGGDMMMASSPPSLGEGGGCTNCPPVTNICSGPTNFTVAYQLSTTNTPPYGVNDLWLEMTVDTNNIANLTIHTPNTNDYYDIYGTTNLSPHVSPLNQTNWKWLQRASGVATNFAWTNITPCEAWFQLGTMLDEDGDGLTTAHERLVTKTDPNNGDTDLDGLGDRDELLQSRNPLVGDNTSPIIHVISPAASLIAQKIIQLDGYCAQRLRRISYTIYTNSTVSDSGIGYVTNQTYDTATKNFTTNFFRCYDLPLAVGLNTIVLQAVDVNNNTNSLSVSYTVDFSIETNAPTFTLLWPTNGMAVSGSSFTMNGTVDNPSASIQVSVASTDETNVFYGIVSGSGGSAFWVPDVTLPAGTSTVTMVVASPGGRSSTSSVSLIKSPIDLTMEQDSYGLSHGMLTYDIPGFISGDVWGPGYTVFVNGIEATNIMQDGLNPNRFHWGVPDVPSGEEGWLEIVLTAIPTGGGTPITAKYEFEKAPLLRLKEEHLDTTITVESPNFSQPPHHEERHWKRKEGGYYTSTPWTEYGCTLHWEWTPEDMFTNYSKVCTWSTNTTGWFAGPPSSFNELTDEYQEVEDGDDFYVFTRSMKQELELRAGGKPYPGRKDLVIVTLGGMAQGYGFNNDNNVPFYPTNAGYVANSAIHLWGETADANGRIYAQLVPSSKTPATPKFDVDSVRPTSGVTQHALVLSANGKKLYNDIGTAKDNEFCVGQKVTLDATWVPPLPDNTTNRLRWLVEPRYVNKIVPANGEVSPQYQLDLNLLTNATTSLWWYDESDDKFIACKWTNIFPSGKMVTGEAKGWASVYRPSLANFTVGSPRSFLFLEGGADKISYGDLANGTNGLSWTNNIVSKYDGAWMITQLLNARYHVEPWPTDKLNTLGGLWLDSSEVFTEGKYRLGTPALERVSLYDYPWLGSPSTGAEIDIKEAQDYIRFCPGRTTNGNIFVTLGIVKWNAHGHRTSTSGWLINSTPAPSAPDRSFDFPVWMRIVWPNSQ